MAGGGIHVYICVRACVSISAPVQLQRACVRACVRSPSVCGGPHVFPSPLCIAACAWRKWSSDLWATFAPQRATDAKTQIPPYSLTLGALLDVMRVSSRTWLGFSRSHLYVNLLISQHVIIIILWNIEVDSFWDESFGLSPSWSVYKSCILYIRCSWDCQTCFSEDIIKWKVRPKCCSCVFAVFISSGQNHIKDFLIGQTQVDKEF